MKPSTYEETVAIIKAQATGRLKRVLAAKHITYVCAMQRISRFRRKFPDSYREISKCQHLSIYKNESAW